ncbi:MAG: 3-keto-5-aminohexanoate cleavage protein [Candidatus Lernaella stagnicola]|nr:3-keto-5-aminohexanoate cleavage protein [Candidatus Lernaella stagnicola]
MAKRMITCALTGAETTREKCPGLPHTAEELAAEAKRVYEAGAAILHLHVRHPDGTPTNDETVFAEAIAAIEAACPILIETTTGGAVGMSDEERLQPIELKPTLASLDCGSVNFSDEILPNSLPQMRMYAERMRAAGTKPTLECFDLGHVHNARQLIAEGLLTPPYNFSFVMGVPGGLPADIKSLMAMIDALPPDSLWTGIGVGGRGFAFMTPGSILLGGHVRVGFEDNIYVRKGVVADSNAELVERAALFIKEMGHEMATVDDAAALLGVARIRSS